MRHSDFVHLHTHTEYSLLDGAMKIDTLIEAARTMRMPALAITDHGNLFGAIEFYRKAHKAGVKPIVGCEVYVAPGSRFDRKTKDGISEASFHLLLLAKNDKGYRNLIKLVSIGYLDGFYYKPRIDKEVLRKYSEGLICLTGCLKGEVPYLVIHGKEKEARNVVHEFQEIFGEENLYLELHDHGLDDQEVVLNFLVELNRDEGIPMVATNDVHYLRRADSEAHDVLLCIQTGKMVHDEDRMRFSSDEFYFKSPDEMKERFSGYTGAVENTIEIAKHCNLELEFEKIYLPHYEAPQGKGLDSYLEELCHQGLAMRYKNPGKDVKERLKTELQVISKMGFSGYFLVIWDLVKFAKERGIPIGPGRGSAAGSLVSYLLGITNIDPLKYNLLFERFLNPDRVSMPDIDIDFCYERRDEVIEYVVQRYGEDHVAQIITFGTMLARAVVRDVGRVLGFSYGEVDRIAKLIPPNKTLQEVKDLPDFARLLKEKPEIKRIIDISISLEGLTRHASTHAAGVVISKDRLTDFVPLYKDPKGGQVTTQFAKDSIEAIGLLKMDFLGLKTLTVIENTRRLVKEVRGEEMNLEDIPMDDPETFSLLSKANTLGVFQIESIGMQDLLRKIRPTTFEDLIALLALYRPGPLNSGMLDEYISLRHGRKKPRYFHKTLEPILKETYGIIVYQEQVMQIASTLGGFTMAEADELRRAMSKKRLEQMEEARERFLSGAKKKGVSERVTMEVFDLMLKFGEYGFNKSHSAAYALISYYTAYQKTHYPLEFMASLLTSELNNTDKISQYISECRRMNIDVLPPDVNESLADFTVVGGRIRFGLAAVKNVGLSAIRSIVEERERAGPYTSLYNFTERVDLRLCNKRVIESLVKCGAFDSLGYKRSQLFHSIDHAITLSDRVQKDRTEGQASLFEIFEKEEGFASSFQSLPDIEEWPENRLLKFEKELLGLYISSHPLARYEKEIKRFSTCSIVEISRFKVGTLITLGGFISGVSLKNTKDGREMAIVEFEDLTGSMEVVFFPDVYKAEAEKLIEESVVFIRGRVKSQEKGRSTFVGAAVIPLDQAQEELAEVVHINLNTLGLDEESLTNLKALLVKNKGKTPVYLHLFTPQRQEIVLSLSPQLKVDIRNGVVDEIRQLFGEDCVWFSSYELVKNFNEKEKVEE